MQELFLRQRKQHHRKHRGEWRKFRNYQGHNRGNLAIENVAPGSATSQICGTILGNVQVSGDAAPLQLGSSAQPPDSCPCNSIGGNLAIDNNTAAVAVYNNAVGRSLSCLNNTSITGAGKYSPA
jgi:hypothetical protein